MAKKKVAKDTVKAVAKEVKDQVKAKVKPSKPQPKPAKKDPSALSEKQEKALALIKKGIQKDAFIKSMGIEVSGYGGLIGNLRKRGFMIECGKDGKLTVGK